MSETIWFLNSRVTIHPSAGGVAVSEHLLPFGDAPPLHVHHHQDEVFHILEGVVRIRVGERETVGEGLPPQMAPTAAMQVERRPPPNGMASASSVRR